MNNPKPCPSNHWNDGNDICADCGEDLNAPIPTPLAQSIIDPHAKPSEPITIPVMEAACCLWEAMLELGPEGCGTLWENGATAARYWAMCNAQALHDDWQKVFPDNFDEPFDWEFTPKWLATKIAEIHP